MKKIVSLLLLTFVLKFSFAQEGAAAENLKNFRFGLKAVPIISWMKPDDKKRFKSDGAVLKFGYGLITEFRLNNVASIATGLEINYLGGKLNFLDTATYVPEGESNKFYLQKRKYKMTYVNLPVVMKMKTPEIGYLTYFGQFGLEAGIRAKGRADDEGYSLGFPPADESQTDVDITKDINLLRLGLIVGLGTEYNLAGSTSLQLGVSYHNGFTSVLKQESNQLNDKKGSDLKQKANSNHVALTIGVLF